MKDYYSYDYKVCSDVAEKLIILVIFIFLLHMTALDSRRMTVPSLYTGNSEQQQLSVSKARRNQKGYKNQV